MSGSARANLNKSHLFDLEPVTPDSTPQPGQLSPKDMEKRLDTFFVTLPFGITQNYNSSPSHSLCNSTSPEKIDPAALTPSEIELQCEEQYFQVLQLHYELNGVGGATAFLRKAHLSEAQQDAKRQALKLGEMLLAMSTCVQQVGNEQQRLIDRVQSTISVINASLKTRNEMMRKKYIARNQRNIKNGFMKSLEIRYHFLFGTGGGNNANKCEAKGVPLQKFYDTPQMTEFVNAAVVKWKANCDAFINVLVGATKSDVMIEDDDRLVAQSFDILKKSFEEYRAKLLAKNEANRKRVEDQLADILGKRFDFPCKKGIKNNPFLLTKDDITSILHNEKENYLQQIISICRDTAIDNFSELKMAYEKEMEDKEKLLLKQCFKLASTEGHLALKSLLDCMERKMGLRDFDVWFTKEAQSRRVTDKHVEMIKQVWMDGLQKIKELCYDTIISDDEDTPMIPKECKNNNARVVNVAAGSVTSGTSESVVVVHTNDGKLQPSGNPLPSRKIYTAVQQQVVTSQARLAHEQQHVDATSDESDASTVIVSNPRKHKNARYKNVDLKTSGEGRDEKRSRKSL